MSETFDKAMDQAANEYRTLFKKMKFVKKTPERVSATNMGMMRARDIDRENNKPENGHDYVFNISTMNQDGTWDRCPRCGDPDINKVSANQVAYQGCFNCHILLGKFQIKSMKSQSQKPKEDSQ